LARQRTQHEIDLSVNAIALDREQFARFGALITRTLGIQMPPSKLPLLENRLRGRMRRLGMATLAEYEEHLFHSPNAADELVHFCDVVTTNKTDFFREPQHFRYLSNVALPELLAQRSTPSARLWCAGCSTGQEAYTLAMVSSEYARANAGFKFSVLATDISTRVLQQAAAAIYPEELIEPVPLELRKRYLLRSKDRRRGLIRMRPELRKAVQFERLNFMDADYGRREPFDVIFFRNVMIYFDRATQEAVVNRLTRWLAPGGYLFIGHSESSVGMRVPLSVVAPSVLRRGE
jgi:chemotaxis protein methyltransferase CheR